MEEASAYLHQLFSLDPSVHRLLFHSGASEGVNGLIWGMGRKEKVFFAYSPLDHSCVRAQAPRLEREGHGSYQLPVDENGDLKFDQAVSEIKAQQKAGQRVLVNWTWVNNEMGVVWSLDEAARFKAATGALIHVDAAQAPGKIEDWEKLNPSLDAYTFSAHKCGALKGVGWSFMGPDYKPEPMILGGGQQHGQRAGTENVTGVWALKLALEELHEVFHPKEQRLVVTELRQRLDRLLVGKGYRVATKAHQLNLNTILFVLTALPSDMTLPLFDLAGLELSAGAACASGTAKPNPVLEALGHGPLARHGLRLSLHWAHRQEEINILGERLAKILEKVPAKK